MNAELTELIKAIADLGVTIVISGIFLYVAIKLINIGIKHLELRLNMKKHDERIDIRTNVNEEIHELLEEAINSLDVKRIQVIEFTNSVVSVANMPFRFMTCTYEVYKLGEVPVGHRIDRLSTSLFTKFFKQLQENDYCILKADEDTHTLCGALYDILKDQHDPQSLCDMMITPKGKAIGYLTMKKDTDFTQNEIDTIQSLSERICALLSVLDN